MFANFFKKRRIRQYAHQLPDELKALYGQQKHYSKAQVDRALTRKRLNRQNNSSASISDNCYAYAMYCSHNEFTRIHDEAGEHYDYDAMRTDIAQTCFSNSDDFTFRDVETYSTESSNSSGSDGGSWWGGDGDSGNSGGDGGGGD